MALSDCAVTIFVHVVKQSNFDVERIEVVTEAEKSATPLFIKGVKMKVIVVAKVRKQLIETIWRRTEANCL